jgi:hypothetical protein
LDEKSLCKPHGQLSLAFVIFDRRWLWALSNKLLIGYCGGLLLLVFVFERISSLQAILLGHQ